jgi:hypothetical protein
MYRILRVILIGIYESKNASHEMEVRVELEIIFCIPNNILQGLAVLATRNPT